MLTAHVKDPRKKDYYVFVTYYKKNSAKLHGQFVQVTNVLRLPVSYTVNYILSPSCFYYNVRIVLLGV